MQEALTQDHLPYIGKLNPGCSSLWTKRCAAFGHTIWGFYYINFGGKLIYTARLWARILGASEAIWAAILAQMRQNFSHMYLHMSSNRYVSRFYEQSSEWPKLMTINSTAQPIETHGKLSGVFPKMKSFILDQATHTLHSAAILFLRDWGERDSV